MPFLLAFCDLLDLLQLFSFDAWTGTQTGRWKANPDQAQGASDWLDWAHPVVGGDGSLYALFSSLVALKRDPVETVRHFNRSLGGLGGLPA